LELRGERQLPVEPAVAWEMLNDVTVLEACVPGVESFVPIGDDRYDVTMTAAIGPLRARFKGVIELADIDEPSAYTLKFDGRGGAAGFARGQARVTLMSTARRQTTLAYVAEAHIGGKLAQIGSRVVDAAAGALADKFFDAFTEQLAHGGAHGVARPSSPFGVWSLLKAFVGRLFPRWR
jgi:carbon monoxide dehydrogenase subunit G